MNKKINTLILITLLLVMVILILIIFNLVNKPENDGLQSSAITETAEPEAVSIDEPVGEDGMKMHTSENGYSVKYPGSMTAKSMAKSIDFILEDYKSGSSLNIVTAKNDGSVKKLTREEFRASLEQSSAETELVSYDEIILNGAEAVATEYIYIDTYVKQYIIVTDSYAYNITVMESEYISDEMSEAFRNVVNSFTLN